LEGVSSKSYNHLDVNGHGNHGSNSLNNLDNGYVEGVGSRPFLAAINSGNNLSILYFNARSIVPKYDELCVVVEANNPDIVCIVEIHALKSCIGHVQLVQAFQEGPLSFLLHVVIDGSEGVSMLSSKHQHLEQLTMLCQKSFLLYTHKVDNSSKFKARLLPPRKAMLTPLGTAWATTCA